MLFVSPTQKFTFYNGRLLLQSLPSTVIPLCTCTLSHIPSNVLLAHCQSCKIGKIKSLTAFQRKIQLKFVLMFAPLRFNATKKPLQHWDTLNVRALEANTALMSHFIITRNNQSPLRMWSLLNQVSACKPVKMLSHALANKTLRAVITIKPYWFGPWLALMSQSVFSPQERIQVRRNKSCGCLLICM